MKNKEELLIKQAKEGYTVCYIDQCPLRNLFRANGWTGRSEIRRLCRGLRLVEK